MVIFESNLLAEHSGLMSETWLFAVGLSLVVAGFLQALIKRLSDTLPRATAMAWQFGLAAIMALVFGMLSGDLRATATGLLIAATGAINFYGAYCQWRAYSFSLSRTSMLQPLAPLWAALLATVFLHEAALYEQAYLLAGIALLHGAAFLMAWPQSGSTAQALGTPWLLFTLAMIAIQGTATLLLAVFAQAVPHGIFLPYWYTGAFLSAAAFAVYTRSPILLAKRQISLIALASLMMAGSMAAAFWAFQLALAGLVLPLQSFGSALLPVLLGWFVFGEARSLSRTQWFGFVVGGAGFAAILAATL
ncbi:MAG: hypothetical protein A2854_04815 [Parcubacteria group bacterium RIFCSPHIGHO2_01_FULL_56_18]|nr:MAG: hypothetical protein A2854_04815 [Parcubacteria group bacterium RIFCSPHIGHO2_01_FULL_56_18]